MLRSSTLVPSLAGRFLVSKSSEGFLSFIAWVSVVGIALGVLALTVVTSVINGFESELSRVITSMNGDAILYSRAEPVSDPGAVEAKIRKTLPEAEAITHSLVMEMMASGPSGVAGAIIEGVDPDTVGQVTSIPRNVVAGRMPEKDGEIAVGSSLADRIGVKPGTQVRLVVPYVGADENNDQETSGAPKALDTTVVGIIKMGMYEYDSKFLFAMLPMVQDFLKLPGKVTSFKIKLKRGKDARAAADRLSDNFGFPFRARDWSSLNKNTLYSIQLEKVVISIILTVIVIVAAFNVIGTLMMMIHDKSKEIAILKAMGFRPTQSFGLFLLIGLGMGIVGTAIGVSGGLGLNWVLARTHLIDLPADIYYISYLPVILRWSEIGLIALVATLIALLATVYPSWKAACRSPLEGLRHD